MPNTLRSGVLFTADLFITFHTGFIVNWRAKRLKVMKGTSVCRALCRAFFGHLCPHAFTSPPQISHHYIWHSTFWVDLLSSLPLLIFIVAFPITGSNKIFAFVQLLRLLRLFRLARLPTVLRCVDVFCIPLLACLVKC